MYKTYGWQSTVSDGATSGTSGQAKRLEGIKINLGDTGYSGGIQYRTHVQTYGWQGWKQTGELSGTTGQAKRLEAIQIKLTGELANHYDIYYRTHVQKFGWLGWAKNGGKFWYFKLCLSNGSHSDCSCKERRSGTGVIRLTLIKLN